MTALDKQQNLELPPVINDFPNSNKGVQFKKETLIAELLSIGNSKLTPQIAHLIGNEIEKEIQDRRIEFLSPELISEMVEGKLAELGLIKPRKVTVVNQTVVELEEKPKIEITRVKEEMGQEVLEMLAPEKAAIPLRPKAKKLPLQFSQAALELIRRWFVIKNEHTQETPEEFVLRVAQFIAKADSKYSPSVSTEETETEFYNLIATTAFLPHPQTLLYADRGIGTLTTGYTLPVEDSMESIFGTLKKAAALHKTGGSVGLNFSSIRPKNDEVNQTITHSSGPVAFMEVYHATSSALKIGGVETETNQAQLDVTHPDIFDFLFVKEKQNFNFGRVVGMNHELLKAAENNELYTLVNPRTKTSARSIDAQRLLNQLADQIVNYGDPDILFTDTLASSYPLKNKIPTTIEPSHLQPLSDFETLPMGSINLALFVHDKQILWEDLKKTVISSIHFLDNVIEVNPYPMPELEEASKRTRKVCLGVMGWAEMLIQLGLSYNSIESINLAHHVMGFITREAEKASGELAKKRGVFPDFLQSIFADKTIKRRNSIITGISPNVILAQLAQVTPGIEPLQSLATKRKQPELNHYLELKLKENNLLNEGILWHAFEHGTISDIPDLPREIKDLFLSAHDVFPEEQIKMQAAFEKFTENRTIKQITLPDQTHASDIIHLIKLANTLGLKGLTFKKHVKTVEMRTVDAAAPVKRKLEKPEVLSGITLRVKSACGDLVITLNGHNGELLEVLTKAEKIGGCSGAQLEALSKVITLSLQSGVGQELITEVLAKTPCPQHPVHDSNLALSFADAIARAIKNFKN